MSHQRVEVTSRAELRRWLKANHRQTESIWLVTYKKIDKRHVPYDVVVEEALCFGWVDSQPQLLDDRRSMRRLSPRNPNSAWSAVNKQRIEKLTMAGLMDLAGLALVEAAKKNGAWDKLNEVEALALPNDLSNALKRSKLAEVYFDLFPRSARKAILDWISQAKKPETRAARILETVTKAENNIRANQWRPSGKL